MKKSILAVLLAVVLVTPIFAAEQGSIDIVGKLGAAVNPEWGYVIEEDGVGEDFKTNPALSIAVEGLYYVLPELPLGLGANYQFDSKGTKYDYDNGVTNVYLTIKPTAKIDSKIFTALYVIGQIGYGFSRISADDFFARKCKVDSNGLYWGLGAGTEIMNDFIFEFVFSTNYWKLKVESDSKSNTYDMRSTALTFFAGYKFNI